ncbi:futalosine hydrolase [Lottiidibacillus patelloidae]|uniref:Futalosine hydrolase n=1 Tax=Lottiidibacillus patelloidae TaxID=2670334 RepID=A0A263BUL2_9BACI|nr:futalosine hydrolase [Lottiidibacillus patelloidae]OZM57375.1 futalosine hydrolase [Lottiidibacillus patelloidae]
MSIKQRILIVTAVDAEKDAVLRGLNGNENFHVIEVGVGPIEAAARTAIALTKENYSLVINAGIAGGFTGKADISSIVVGDSFIAADLGAETEHGFSSLNELGFGSSIIDVDQHLVSKVYRALKNSQIPVNKGSILTISTVTGSKETTTELANRVPNATAEAMEGYGVAMAAKQFNIPAIEVRAISNKVGPRNKSEWKIKDALQSLEATFQILSEVL